MAAYIIPIIGFLLMLWLVLFTVRKLRPQTFHFKATLTKWVSLDLEVRSPESGPKPIAGHGDETQD